LIIIHANSSDWKDFEKFLQEQNSKQPSGPEAAVTIYHHPENIQIYRLYSFSAAQHTTLLKHGPF